MQLSRAAAFSSLIVLVIVASLASLAYPSVSVPFYSTETFVNTSTIASTSTYVNVNTILTWWSYYVTNSYQFYVPGSCWGGGGCFYILSSTVTSQTSTDSTITSSSTNQISVTSQLAYSNELTHTYSANVPVYASLGMNGTEFILVAVLIIVLGVFVIFYSLRDLSRHKTGSITTLPRS